jgi:hypothetical protein
MNIAARTWSWIIGLSGIVLPASLYAWQAINFSNWKESQNSYVCGMPLFFAFIISIVLSIFLSFTAFAIGYSEFRDISKPRPWHRTIELIILCLPIISVFLYIIFLVAWIIWA